MAPRNGGAIENPELTGHAGAPGRSAFIILYLAVREDSATAAKYHTVGCGPTIASVRRRESTGGFDRRAGQSEHNSV
jgi:NifU-like protein involved in Fe-S cluster formation